jgi:hypothetical protein
MFVLIKEIKWINVNLFNKNKGKKSTYKEKSIKYIKMV